MKRTAVAAAVVLGLVGVLALYVAGTAGRELLRARAALADVSLDTLDRNNVVAARSHLLRATEHLSSLPARALRLLPVARQNIDAASALSSGARPVLDAALSLDAALDELEKAGFLHKGRVDVDKMQALRGPLSAEAEALEGFGESARASLNGWLLPPVWEQIDGLIRRYQPLLRTATHVSELLEEAPALFGVDERRSYLVLLINNAELRGAGGVLSGVGELVLRDGKLELGSFQSVHALRDDPPERVPAPADFRRRFEPYKADSTLWLNTTYSPDVPDVALVAARLFRKKTGIATDGAIVVDPRGLAALADPGSPVEIEELGIEVETEDLGDFVYSDVYGRFQDQARRRAALLETGREVFSGLTSGGLGSERLEGLGAALTGGHLRFVSFDASEQRVFERLGIAGELSTPPGVFAVGVTEQNLGAADGEGTKLDFWVGRDVEHSCDLTTETASCATGIQLRNRAPKGLVEYVAGEPYARFRAYVEIYLPKAAVLEGVTLDGADVEFRVEREEGQQAVGVYVEVPQGEAAWMRADYSLPVPPEGFHLRLRPQPLARDARLSVAIEAPEGWVVTGSGVIGLEDVLTTRWSGPVDLVAEPDSRSGLAAAWADLKRFWSGRVGCPICPIW